MRLGPSCRPAATPGKCHPAKRETEALEPARRAVAERECRPGGARHRNRPHTPLSKPRDLTLTWALVSHRTSLALSFLLCKKVKTHLQWVFIHRMNILLWTGIRAETGSGRKGLTSQSQEDRQPTKASWKRPPGAETRDRSAPGSRPAYSGSFCYFAHTGEQVFREIGLETAY